MEKRLKKKVADVLAGVLAPNEELLIGANGLHPRLTSGIGFYLTILVGATTGSILQSAFGWSTVAVAPGIGIGVALVARWLYYFRARSKTQPVGAIPLIGLTDDRLIFVETDFWGRPTGSREEVLIRDINDFYVRKRVLGLPNAILNAADGGTIHYQIRYADRMAAEIDQLRSGG
jgi:hypothetical protein